MATIVEKIYEAALSKPKDEALFVIEAMMEAWADASYDSITATPNGYTLDPAKFKASLKDRLSKIP